MKNVYQAFVPKDQGAVKECVGNKIDFSWDGNGMGKVKSTQSVLVQKLADNFEPPWGAGLKIFSMAGTVKDGESVPLNAQTATSTGLG
jgi:hypothetical protein